MQVILDGQTLADWGEYLSAQDLDGRCVVESVDIVRATTKFLEYRGNEQVSFNFTIEKQFASLALAETFYVTYWSSLTKTGALTLNCGYDDTDSGLTAVTAANAILERIRFLDPIGCTMKIQFYLIFGSAAS
jgi:hypothetical protein